MRCPLCGKFMMVSREYLTGCYVAYCSCGARGYRDLNGEWTVAKISYGSTTVPAESFDSANPHFDWAPGKLDFDWYTCAPSLDWSIG